MSRHADTRVQAYKIGASGCECTSAYASRVHNNEGIFETYEVCRSALLRQTLLDKVFKAVESQPEVRACMVQIEKLASRATCSDVSAEMESLNALSMTHMAKYNNLIISPVAALSDAQIKEMSDTLRMDQRTGASMVANVTAVTTDYLLSTFMTLFPALVTDEMRDTVNSRNNHFMTGLEASVLHDTRRECFEYELAKVKTSLEELQRVVQLHKLEMEQHKLMYASGQQASPLSSATTSSLPHPPPRDIVWPDQWKGRLRVTGRRRRRTTVLVDNLQKNDIILQRFGNTCEVDRLY